MRAIYLNDGYEVELRDLPEPEPGADEVLVRVQAGGICGTDMSVYANNHFLRRAPQILGHEVSGEVVRTGSAVHGWGPGDRVFVSPLVVCGECAACRAGRPTQCESAKLPGLDLPGLFSDLIAMPAKVLHRLPDQVNWRAGAMIEPTSVAHHAVRRAEPAKGSSVAVLGAGPIGALAALICHHVHEARLLVSDLKPSNLDLLTRLTGAATVDPSAASVVETGREMTDGVGFDVVLVANHSPQCLADAIQMARSGGRVVAIAAAYEGLPEVNVPMLVWHELELRGTFAFDDDDIRSVIELIAAGMPVEELATHVHRPEDATAVFAAMAAGDGGHMKTLFEFV
ncbi:MAG: alcohol dehydrogenase catalytic domain-containing protein [Actinobacteria bacterium]|nr:alcohol dehydrogenase catalytic domain-containing protein [Actinomycetota bacterium]